MINFRNASDGRRDDSKSARICFTGSIPTLFFGDLLTYTPTVNLKKAVVELRFFSDVLYIIVYLDAHMLFV